MSITVGHSGAEEGREVCNIIVNSYPVRLAIMLRMTKQAKQPDTANPITDREYPIVHKVPPSNHPALKLALRLSGLHQVCP